MSAQMLLVFNFFFFFDTAIFEYVPDVINHRTKIFKDFRGNLDILHYFCIEI